LERSGRSGRLFAERGGDSPVAVEGPKGRAAGYWIEGEALPISVENIHSDYAESDTTITFRLSNKNKLHLFFPAQGACSLVLDPEVIRRGAPPSLRRGFPIDVAIVPVLGPVEHDEELVKAETVQRYQMTHRASRHFRNYWYSFPEGFDEFALLLAAVYDRDYNCAEEVAEVVNSLK
jgi:hypothetical protein